MECFFFGEGENAFFIYDIIDNNRKLKTPIYPRPFYALLDDSKMKYETKKEVDGEIRFISADIAAMAGSSNDNSVYMIFQLIPQGNNQYLRNIIYIESKNGGHTVDQAVRIRQLYDDFECDYIVIDVKNLGLSVYDNLVDYLYDAERDITYEPFSCMNYEDLAKRCKSPNADRKIFGIKANENFNSECAVSLRDGFKRGKVKILINEQEGTGWLNTHKSYVNLTVEEQVLFSLPFYQTTLMIHEMVNLSSETSDSGAIRVKEPNGMRKDRYTALSYGNYFANYLESDLRVSTSIYDFICIAD